MTELIKAIISELVSNKDAIKITELEPNESGVVVYKISVDENDTGRIIGKNGKTAKAIRSIVRAASVRKGIKVAVDII